MQVIYKSVLAFKNCQTVFRSHSSGALPVLAITGFRFVVKPIENHMFLDQQGSQNRSLFRPLGELLWSSSGNLWGSFPGSSLGLLWVLL